MHSEKHSLPAKYVRSHLYMNILRIYMQYASTFTAGIWRDEGFTTSPVVTAQACVQYILYMVCCRHAREYPGHVPAVTACTYACVCTISPLGGWLALLPSPPHSIPPPLLSLGRRSSPRFLESYRDIHGRSIGILYCNNCIISGDSLHHYG